VLKIKSSSAGKDNLSLVCEIKASSAGKDNLILVLKIKSPLSR